MKLNRTPNPLDRNTRNSDNENWDIIEGEFKKVDTIIGDVNNRVDNIIDEVSDEAFNKIVDNARLNWKEPVDNFSDLPSNAQEGDTRMDKSTGKVYRYDGAKWVEIQQIDAGPVNELDSRLSSQLADKSKKISDLSSSQVKGTGGSISKLDSVAPTLVFIDDDARNELYSKWFPYVKQKGIQISAAVITDRIDKDSSHVTSEQLKEMHDSGFIELCNHTKNHVHLANLTEDEIHVQIRDAQRFLEDLGIFTKHLVYPFGSLDERVRKIASLYVDSATQSNDRFNQVNTRLLDSYKMSRIVLERPLETHKQMIDDIVSQNGLMIINTHSQYPEFSTSKIDEIVDYAESKGVDITTITTAYNRFRNLIEFKGSRGITSGISATGYGVGDFKKTDVVYEYINSTNLKQITPITAYKKNKITTTYISTAEANANGWELGAGVLITDRRSRDEYSYQEYRPINSSKIYRRSWRSSRDEWYPFENVSGIKTIVYTAASEVTIEPRKRHNYTIEGLGSNVGDIIIVNPTKKMPTGILVGGLVSESNIASIEITNITDQAITLPAQTSYRIKAL